jgi:hypothetical protein
MFHRSLILGVLGGLMLGLSARGQVVINEVCADNGSILSPGGTAPDYIELYNAGTAAVSLSGWALTDDISVKNKYLFPTGTSIAAKGRLVVWLDSVTNYAGLIATNFSLRSSGEEVGLFQGTTQKDYVAFGPQIQDKVLCRIPDGSNTWKLGEPTPGATNVAITLGLAAALRINELLATNSLGSDWLELYNTPTNPPVAIGGMVFSQTNAATNLPALLPNSFIDADGFIQFLCSGDTNRGDHLNFKLSSSMGETITLFASNRTTVIDRVTFGPQTRDVSYGRLPDGGTNFFLFSPTNRVTPGAPNDWQPLTNVVISEVLTHTDPPLEDAIELQNLTAQPVDISNWWLSNSRDQPFKFQIPSGTVIPAYGFKVFFEQAGAATPGFNRSGTGDSPDFTLNSAHGDEVVLTAGSATAGVTGFRSARDFGAAANGVAFIRYVKSRGGTDMVPESGRTFGHDNPASLADFRLSAGLTNAYPLVGPIAFSEIMYHPPDLIAGGVTNDNSIDEFIELTSLTNSAVPLYDPAYPTNTWHIEGGVSFRFPTNVSVAPGARILIVNFDPLTNLIQLADFRAKYGVNPSVPLFGPYAGKLNNSADSLELYRPDSVQLPPHPDAGFVPSVLVEKVKYEEANGWPTNADGRGHSVHRLSMTGYANDETNWFGAAPSAGGNTPPGDAPQIIFSPSNQTVLAGATVSLSVSHSGTAPFGYQWFVNGTNLAGATANPIVLSNVQPEQSGSYHVAISNAYGSVSSAVATLTIGQPPEILAPPTSVTATQGLSASFKVVTKGSTPLYYQWRFNGSELAGATNDTLTITSVQAAQAGAYTVVVSNSFGAALSEVATLTVGLPPGLIAMPKDQFVAVGANVSFAVTAVGTAPLLYQWRTGGSNLPGATLATLSLNNVQTNQSSSYEAVVMNGFGSTSAVANLSVAGPPSVRVDLSAYPLPRITLSGSPGHVYEIERSADLTNWITVSRFTNSSGQETVTDAAATNSSYRFYRGRLVP